VRLRFVAASEEALAWSYERFSNPVLWLLQHDLWDALRRTDLPELIARGWWLGYRPSNTAFAQTIAAEVRADPRLLVQVHDYHLYLVPRLVRQAVPWVRLEHFTHIPWPKPEAWLRLPAAIRRDICEGLLGADLLGFQTPDSVVHFLRCCAEFVPNARIDHSSATVGLDGRVTRIREYPISVDPAGLARQAGAPETLVYKARLRGRCGERTIVRVDRLDPSKNVALGFRAFRLLLESRPDLIGRVRMLAFLVPSRTTLDEYRHYAGEVWREVDALNTRFGRDGWRPVDVFHEDNRRQALAGMALADVVLVNPVADGMNLVAKEAMLVGEQDPVLVLSQACGAHAQLGAAALSVPPRDVEATAVALERALNMPLAERRCRAAALRALIRAEDLSWWLGRQLHDLLAAHDGPGAPAGETAGPARMLADLAAPD
jgi:trehalose 6-phosphate synthase